MNPATLEAPIAMTAKAPRKHRRAGDPRTMTLEQFRSWKPTDGWKYDWNHGIATRSVRGTSAKQRHVVRNLQRAFTATTAFEDGGNLMAEPETQTSPDQVRVPDLAYFPRSYDEALREGRNLFPPFVIEIISKNDNYLLYKAKLREYFQAGAQVVWHVGADFGEVEIFTSPTSVSIKTADELCSAMPAVDFAIKVADIFKQ